MNISIHGKIINAVANDNSLDLIIADIDNAEYLCTTLRLIHNPVLNLSRLPEVRILSGNINLKQDDNTTISVPVSVKVCIPSQLVMPHHISLEEYVGLDVTIIFEKPEQ